MVAKPMIMRSWWVLGLRGVLALAFGALALTMPGPTVLSLVALFVVYALLSGIVYLAGVVRNRRHATGVHSVDWWVLLLLGLASVAAGLIAAAQPLLAALVLVVVIGVNALVTGVLDIILAVRLRHRTRGGCDWLLLANGLAAIVFGTILVALPGVGALALVWLIGVYALVAGVLYLALALRAYERAPRAQGSEAERRVADRRMTPAGQH